MNIARFSVERSLAVNLLSVLIVAGGLVMGLQLPREAFPNVDYGYVSITTAYPGSTPKEVEKLVTIPLEDELRDVDGVDEVTSISLEGLSMIMVKLDVDAADTNRILTDIQRAADRAGDLPEEADDPIVDEINTHDEPILIVSLAGEDLWEVRRLTEELEDLIEEVPGVARADKIGWKDTEIWVDVEPEKLAAYHVSFGEVARALAARNANVPGGKVYVDGTQHVVRTLGEFATPEEIAQVIIRSNDQGHALRVRDVAEVHFALEEGDRLDKTNGRMAMNLMIVKKDGVDTLRLVKRLTEEIDRFEARVPSDVTVTQIEDLALKYVRRRLGILVNNGLIGSVLLAAVLFLFLGWRVALLTAFGIPISFCIAAIYMRSAGVTINLIAMFGLIMVLGMLVDDAIVVSENAYRYIERGMPPREAAVRGTSEVISAVTATILTTVLFFGSLLFMTGIMGKFIWVIPAVVITALLGSLFEAAVILPAHIADFAGRGQTVGSRLEHSRWFRNLRGWYMRMLKRAIRRRWLVFAAAMAVFVGSLAAAAAGMTLVLFPSQGVELFFIRAEAPAGTSLQGVEERFRPVERAVAALPDRELEHFITTIGMIQDTPGDPQQRRGTNLGQIQVFLTSASKRDREAEDIIEQLREDVGTVEGLDVTFESIRTGPPVGKPIEAHIRGAEFDALERIAEEMKAFLEGIPGVRDVRDNFEPGKPEFRVLVDEEAARRARINVADIGRAVRFAFEGIAATSIKQTDEEIDVRVRFPESARENPAAMRRVMIENDAGALIPLEAVSRFAEAPGLSSISRLDFKRSITVSATVDERTTTSFKANRRLIQRFSDIPARDPGYTVRYGGEQEETMTSLANFRRAFLLSLLAGFIILAITFNSLKHPVLVMSAIPFGLVGVIWAFILHGLPVSFMMILGTIGLSGVVLNDAIVLVSFILQERRVNRSLLRAVIGAGRLRLRPVLMTTVTTIVGLAPVAYGIGGLDPFLRPAALAMTWGLAFATVLTLILIPCLYVMETDVDRWVRRWRNRRIPRAGAELGTR
ncbi:MAG TPA: efflux RND transporter permease subunit [bacterium]